MGPQGHLESTRRRENRMIVSIGRDIKDNLVQPPAIVGNMFKESYVNVL